MPPSRLNFKVISSFEEPWFFINISPIFLEYLQTGYLFSFFGVIVTLPILYPFEPVLIFPMTASFFLCSARVFLSRIFLDAVFSFFEM
jgi:hypothetical protein